MKRTTIIAALALSSPAAADYSCSPLTGGCVPIASQPSAFDSRYPVPAYAADRAAVDCSRFVPNSDDEHKDWKTLERTLEDQRQKGNITNEQRDTLMEAYKPGFREYRDQLREECDRLQREQGVGASAPGIKSPGTVAGARMLRLLRYAGLRFAKLR
jgi:hypothetical protein